MFVEHRSSYCCQRVVLPFSGVQFPFSAANFRAIAVYRIAWHEMDEPIGCLPRQKLRWMRGRICEVHVPTRRFTYFTFAYSHLRRSTGILPCGAIGCSRTGGTS